MAVVIENSNRFPYDVQTPWGWASAFGRTENGLALMFNRNDVTDWLFLALNTVFEDGKYSPAKNGPCFFYDWRQSD